MLRDALYKLTRRAPQFFDAGGAEKSASADALAETKPVHNARAKGAFTACPRTSVRASHSSIL